MKDISAFSKIVIASRPVDFRKQANGLSSIVMEIMEAEPFDPKSLFVFINRKKTSIRMLYWDLTGFATWCKKLEKDRFKWPKKADGAKMALSSRDPRRRPTPRRLGAWVSDAIEAVFEQALAVDPGERYARAGDFWSAFDGLRAI